MQMGHRPWFLVTEAHGWKLIARSLGGQIEVEEKGLGNQAGCRAYRLDCVMTWVWRKVMFTWISLQSDKSLHIDF